MIGRHHRGAELLVFLTAGDLEACACMDSGGSDRGSGSGDGGKEDDDDDDDGGGDDGGGGNGGNDEGERFLRVLREKAAEKNVFLE